MPQAMPRLDAAAASWPRLLDRAAAVTPQTAAVAFYFALMTGTLVAVLGTTAGRLIYSLDDAYIHLALAERLAQGHYGINLGEITSPSSSVIWPFLMLLGAGTAAHQFVPLVLNTAFGAGTAWLLGRATNALTLPAGLSSIAVACLLVLGTNLVGLAFTGLEHSLQVLLAVTVAVALIEHQRGTMIPTWALLAATLGPAVRYEMFAIVAAVVLVLLLERKWRTVLLVGAASIALPALLAGFLVMNGNTPLPNSVMAKLHGGDPETAQLPWLQFILTSYLTSFMPKNLMLGILLGLAYLVRSCSGASRTISLAALLAGLLHMTVGQFGWFNRYEIYAVAFCGLIAISRLAELAPRYVFPAALCSASIYLSALVATPYGARNIFEQQYQMHRFVQEHYRKPFAVNDLGWVSFGLDRNIYVLDLWGLASGEAMRQRIKNAAWLDGITQRHNTGLAIINTEWLRDIPPSWRKVGELTISGPQASVASRSVSFFATRVGDRQAIVAGLTAFKPTLPAGSELTLALP